MAKKRLFFLFAALTGLFLSACASAVKPANITSMEAVQNEGPLEDIHIGETFRKEEGMETFTIPEAHSHYYERESLYEGWVYRDDEREGYVPGAPSYDTPNESNETSVGFGGNTNAGTLTLTGNGLKREGRIIPQGSFDYTSFSYGSSVKFDFKFHKMESTDALPKYGITNCPSSQIDGHSLPGGSIGSGALLILKRVGKSQSWTLATNLSLTNLANGRNIEFVPEGKDIGQGAYYMFLAAYQYRFFKYVESYPFAFWESDLDQMVYGFRNVLQRTTVYVAPGGSSVQFVLDTLPEKSYYAFPTFYESLYEEGSVSLGSNVTKSRDDDISIYPISAGTELRGEILLADSEKGPITSSASIYRYVGTEDVVLTFKPRAAYSIPEAMRTKAAPITSLGVAKTSNGSPEPVAVALKGAYFQWALLGLTKEGNDYQFKVLRVETSDDLNLVRSSQNAIDVHLEPAEICSGKYELFSFVFLQGVNIGEQTYVEASQFRFVLRGMDMSQRISSFSEGAEIEMYPELTKAVTLADGALCFSPFRMKNALTSTYKVECSYNGGVPEAIEDEEKTFINPGKYRFQVTNAFGETTATTLYIVNPFEESAKDAIFGERSGLLDERYRVYDAESVYPCYKAGVPFALNASTNLPGLFVHIFRVYKDGSISLLQTFEDIHSPIDGVLEEVGQYYFSCSLGDPNKISDHIDFSFYFHVVEPDKYVPTVNYDLLYSGVFTSSFSPKVYEVTYQPEGGEGTYHFVSTLDKQGYNDALDTALEIESLSLKKFEHEDGSYDYIYEDKAYSSKFTLFAAMKENAEKRVHFAFLDANLFAGEDVADYQVEDPLHTPIEEDRYVVLSEEIFKRMMAEPVYINHFTFTQVREWESSSVAMTLSSSATPINIEYGVDVSEQLTQSGKYTVKETNHCGTRTYDVIFVKEGENSAKITLIYDDGASYLHQTMAYQGKALEVTANTFLFREVSDKIDPYGVVALVRNGEKREYLYEEIQGTILDGSGTYEITVRNRIGHRFSFALTVNGENENPWPHYDDDNPIWEAINA